MYEAVRTSNSYKCSSFISTPTFIYKCDVETPFDETLNYVFNVAEGVNMFSL